MCRVERRWTIWSLSWHHYSWTRFAYFWWGTSLTFFSVCISIECNIVHRLMYLPNVSRIVSNNTILLDSWRSVTLIISHHLLVSVLVLDDSPEFGDLILQFIDILRWCCLLSSCVKRLWALHRFREFGIPFSKVLFFRLWLKIRCWCSCFLHFLRQSVLHFWRGFCEDLCIQTWFRCKTELLRSFSNFGFSHEIRCESLSSE